MHAWLPSLFYRNGPQTPILVPLNRAHFQEQSLFFKKISQKRGQCVSSQDSHISRIISQNRAHRKQIGSILGTSLHIVERETCFFFKGNAKFPSGRVDIGYDWSLHWQQAQT